MILEVKKVDAVKRELKFKVDKDRVSKALDEIYVEIGKNAKIPGFRPGKAPRHMIESQHGHLAKEETVRKLIPEIYREGIEKEKLEPIDLPEIHDVKFQDGVITFTAKLDIRPEVHIKNYKGIKVTRKSSQVTEEELNKTFEYFKQGQGKDKEITIDDTFAHGLGYPSLEEFKKFLTRQLEMDKDRHNRMDVENQIIEELIKNAKMTVPQSLVARQMERRVAEAKEHYKSHGMPEAEIAKKEEELRKSLKDVVERDVKVYLILEEIAKQEKLEVKEGESLPAKTIEFLLKEAKWEETK